MKFCSHCGNEVSEDAAFCYKCGHPTNGTKLTTPTSNHVDSPKKTSVSLILGIIGIVFSLVFALVGHITSIIGIILGIKEYSDTKYMTGLILSIIGEVCCIFSSIIGAVIFASLF